MNFHDSDIMVHWKVKSKGYQSMFLFIFIILFIIFKYIFGF